MTKVKLGLGLALVLVGASADLVQAQCTMPPANQFSKKDLVARSSGLLNRPSHMAIVPNGNVFIAEMWSGKIKLYDPTKTGVSEVGTIDIYRDNAGANGAGTENGLLGLAVDPNFATTNWLYVFFSRKISDEARSSGDGSVREHEHVLRRYTITGGKLSNPKDLLKVPRISARHAAGGLAINKTTGDLFITTGDDTYPSSDNTKYGGRNEASDYLNSLRTSANTNDLRGKVLRIRPIPFADSQDPGIGVGKSYTIPEGNLFPVGTAKTLPEIYTMGHRNPYKVKVDHGSGMAIVGEVGPDGRSTDPQKGPIGHDEFNLITKAGNYGWPFANANNQMYIAIAGEAYAVGTKFDPNNLKNLSKFNTGLQDLPPAVGAIGYYASNLAMTGALEPFNNNRNAGSSAIAGPFYRYSAESQSKVKLPPFLHGKFILGDWKRERLWSVELDANLAIKKVENLYSGSKIIDVDIGPNGEIYLLEYGYDPTGDDYHGQLNTGSLYKLEYTGTQYELSACSQYVVPVVGTSNKDVRKNRSEQFYQLVNLSVTRQIAIPSDKVLGILYNLNGEQIWRGMASDGMLNLPSISNNSLAFLRFE